MGDLDLLKKAESLEFKRIDFYKKSADKILDPSGKQVLKDLEKAEKRHFDILKKQAKNIKLGGEVDSKGVKSICSKMKGRFDVKVKSNQKDINLIEKAIVLEKEDASFYICLEGKTGSRKLVKLFKILEKEERSHLKLLKKTLKDLRRRGVAEFEGRNSKAMFLDMFNRK